MRKVKLIKKKEFVEIVFDPEHKDFVVHIAIFSSDFDNKIYLLKKTWIAYIKTDKAFKEVFSNYIDFMDVFLPKISYRAFKVYRYQ